MVDIAIMQINMQTALIEMFIKFIILNRFKPTDDIRQTTQRFSCRGNQL